MILENASLHGRHSFAARYARLGTKIQRKMWTSVLWRVWRYDLSQGLALAAINITEGACNKHKAGRCWCFKRALSSKNIKTWEQWICCADEEFKGHRKLTRNNRAIRKEWTQRRTAFLGPSSLRAPMFSKDCIPSYTLLLSRIISNLYYLITTAVLRPCTK